MTERHTPPTPSNAEARLFGKLQEAENRLGRLEQSKLGVVSWGFLGGEAEILAGTGDFVPARIGEGTYRLTWKSPRASAAYAVVATATGDLYCSTRAVSTTLVELLFKTTGGVATNTGFSFIVMANS